MLLYITHKKTSVIRMTRKGITFTEIANQTQKCMEEGLMINQDNKIELTESGIRLLEDLKKEFKNINKDQWIEKDFQNKIERIDKNAIFVPRQSELNF